MDIETLALGYMLGSSSDSNNEQSSSGGIFPFGAIFIIVFNFVILYFLGDTIFDLCGFDFFLEDENINAFSSIVRVSNELKRDILPIIPISVTTSLLVYFYTLNQRK